MEKESEKETKLSKAVSSLLYDLKNNETNITYINKNTYNNLGKYQKNMLYMFGRMLDLVKEGQIINYHEFVKIFEKLISMKNDTEKQYLFGLFFPKTIKNATFLNPL